MRSVRSILTTVSVTLLLASASVLVTPVIAGAGAGSGSGSGSGVTVEAIDARIEQAQRRITRFEERAARWQRRIGVAAARVQRLDWIVRYGDVTRTVRADGSPRVPLEERLRIAHRTLQRVLTEPEGRSANQQVQAWNVRLTELEAARDAAIAAAAEPDPISVSDPAPGGPITYETWARSFLDRLGAPGCDENLVAVVAWETQEGTTAAFNPLATTRLMPGATAMNDVGVRNYVSLNQGLDASRDTLEQGAEAYRYGAVIDALRSCARAEATARAVRDSAWCSGCGGGAYLIALIPGVREHYADHAGRLVSTVPA